MDVLPLDDGGHTHICGWGKGGWAGCHDGCGVGWWEGKRGRAGPMCVVQLTRLQAQLRLLHMQWYLALPGGLLMQGPVSMQGPR